MPIFLPAGRPKNNARREMGSVRMTPSMTRRRPRRTVNDLEHPDEETVSADDANSDERPDSKRQNKESKDLDPPPSAGSDFLRSFVDQIGHGGSPTARIVAHVFGDAKSQLHFLLRARTVGKLSCFAGAVGRAQRSLRERKYRERPSTYGGHNRCSAACLGKGTPVGEAIDPSVERSNA